MKPDPHYLERTWDTFSLNLIAPGSDAEFCEHLRFIFFLGASISLAHLTKQDNEEDAAQAGMFMNEEIQKYIPEALKKMHERRKKT